MPMKYREIIFVIKLKFNLRFSYMLSIHAAAIYFVWVVVFEFQKVFKFSWNLVKQRFENKIGKLFIFSSSLSLEIGTKAQILPFPFLFPLACSILVPGTVRAVGRGPASSHARASTPSLSSSTDERVPCPWVTDKWGPPVRTFFHLVSKLDSTLNWAPTARVPLK